MYVHKQIYMYIITKFTKKQKYMKMFRKSAIMTAWHVDT